MDKIESYIGFAIKSGKILYGLDNIQNYRKKIHLLLLCPSAGDNLKKETEYLSEKRNLTLITTDVPLEQLTHKMNCKLAAILSYSLAKAVTDNIRR